MLTCGNAAPAIPSQLIKSINQSPNHSSASAAILPFLSAPLPRGVVAGEDAAESSVADSGSAAGFLARLATLGSGVGLPSVTTGLAATMNEAHGARHRCCEVETHGVRIRQKTLLVHLIKAAEKECNAPSLARARLKGLGRTWAAP